MSLQTIWTWRLLCGWRTTSASGTRFFSWYLTPRISWTGEGASVHLLSPLSSVHFCSSPLLLSCLLYSLYSTLIYFTLLYYYLLFSPYFLLSPLFSFALCVVLCRTILYCHSTVIFVSFFCSVLSFSCRVLLRDRLTLSNMIRTNTDCRHFIYCHVMRLMDGI